MFTPEYFSSVTNAAIPVRLAARSFILPIPLNVGSLMVYPHDIDDQPNMKAGMPILDKTGKPKGTGIVFTNYTDGAVQAVRSDGKCMIIINGISDEHVQKLHAYCEANITNPQQADEKQIRDILHYAHDELGIEDFFDGDQAKIPDFEPIMQHSGDSKCGGCIRRSDEERFALMGVGSGTYAGPASSPQRFTQNVVLVCNAKHAWLVQTEAFLHTYSHPDKREISVHELPTFKMIEGVSPAPVLVPILPCRII